MRRYRSKEIADRVEREYRAVPEDVRENLIAAAQWAQERLRNHEGAGHIMNITAEGGMCVCSFAKPEWAGDHSGSPEELGSEAIARAVIEYLNGC